MVKIKVPATTANLGPGFDTLGLALNLFQEILIEKSDQGLKNILWRGEVLDENTENYVVKALECALATKKQHSLGYTLTMLDSKIPISSGLGSSAAAIVAGIYAANYLMDYAMTHQEILDLATHMEGHPDNVAPAIFGNLIIATTINGRTHFASIDFPDDLQLKVFIPQFKLSTSVARDALPEFYTRTQCVHNISRTSFLIHALLTKNYENLSMALSDEIHQPYRIALIEDGEKIQAQISNTNAFGYFISGAGPTIIALIKKGDLLFDHQLKLNTEAFKNKWNCFTIDINKSGAIYEIVK